ncbi:MAG: DNA-formamidopyrimidine glycosylase, partial [Patescibacteria group bacterium]
MPELPEVETIKNQLNRLVAGKKISGLKVFLPKIIKGPKSQLVKAVLGAKITRLARRAKILIFELNNGFSILAHLKMTGQLIYQAAQPETLIKNKHTRAIFLFSDKTCLLFNDLRQFGYLRLLKSAALKDFFAKEKFGPEILTKEFTLKKFRAILAKRPRIKIKQFLLDQRNLAGVGNIYADEVLFFAGVRPERRVADLGHKASAKLFSGLKKILTQAIKLRGTSARDYLDALGQTGNFASKLKVYGQEGKNCVKCKIKSKITRLKIGGRSA